MKQGYGNYVTGDDFWDREPELALFIQKIREGAHISLLAPRRMGKTSFMHEVAGRMSGEYLSLFIDLQKSDSAADFLMELGRAVYPHKALLSKCTAIASSAFNKLAQIVDTVDIYEFGIKLRSEINEGNWETEADKLLDVIAEAGKPAIIFMDEVPILVNRLLKGEDFAITPERRRKTDKFLSWLRENSLRRKGEIRFVISGSIGLAPILNQAGLSATFNTFFPFQLKPWDEITAKNCLTALAKNYALDLPDGTKAKITALLGCLIPHHLQMFFAHLCDHCGRKSIKTPSPDEAAAVYKEDMLGVRGYTELVHYEERLKFALGGGLLPAAFAVLSAAASKRTLKHDEIPAILSEYGLAGEDARQAREQLFQVFEHDGYLRQTKTGWVFVSGLVRDWWRKRHCR